MSQMIIAYHMRKAILYFGTCLARTELPPGRERLRLILKPAGKALGDLADATGQSRQYLSNKRNRGSFSEKEICAVVEAPGCTVEIVFRQPDGTEK